MSCEMEIYEEDTKEWNYNLNHKNNGITEDNKDIWVNAFNIGIFNNKDTCDKWYLSGTEDKKLLLWKAALEQLDEIKENLRLELETDISIKPFVDKFTATKKLFKQIDDQQYKNIKGLKAEITEEEYDYFLGVLPPLDFDGNAFFMCEYLTGDLTTRYWCEDKKYYCEVVERPRRIND